VINRGGMKHQALFYTYMDFAHPLL